MLINVALHVKSYHGKVTGAEPKKPDVAVFLFYRTDRQYGQSALRRQGRFGESR